MERKTFHSSDTYSFVPLTVYEKYSATYDDCNVFSGCWKATSKWADSNTEGNV